MNLSLIENLANPKTIRINPNELNRGALQLLILIVAICALNGCGGDKESDATRTANANASAGARDNSPPAGKFAVDEPERYRIRFGLEDKYSQPPQSSDATGNRNQSPQQPQTASKPAQAAPAKSGAKSSPPPNTAQRVVNPIEVSLNEFELDKAGSDRRWSFQLPGIGSVVYLEKSGLKYLVLYDRRQYFEVSAADLGFEPGIRLNPIAAANSFANKCDSESLGLDQVASRNAFKFKFLPRPGGADAQRFSCSLSVDQETRLPTRFEVIGSTGSGADEKTLLEARELKLNLSTSVFDVPAGMVKIKTSDAKSQIESFAAGVRRFINALNPPETQKKPDVAGNSNAATNSNRSVDSKAASANSKSNSNQPKYHSSNARSKNLAILSK